MSARKNMETTLTALQQSAIPFMPEKLDRYTQDFRFVLHDLEQRLRDTPLLPEAHHLVEQLIRDTLWWVKEDKRRLFGLHVSAIQFVHLVFEDESTQRGTVLARSVVGGKERQYSIAFVHVTAGIIEVWYDSTYQDQNWMGE